MGHERTLKHGEAADELQHRNRVQRDVAADAPTTDDPRATLDLLGKIASGAKRPTPTLVAEVTRLANNDREQVWDTMPGLARHLTGEQFLEIATIVNYPLGAALESAKPIAPERLRQLLRSLSPEQLAQLGDSPKALANARKALPGPLGLELPALAEVPEVIHGKPAFIQWFVQTTDKTVAAITLAENGDAELARSLDQLKEWSWLDHLHIAHARLRIGNGLRNLLGATQDASAKATITQMLSGPASISDSVADGPIARKEMAENAAHHGDTNALLDSAARGSFVPEPDNKAIVARLAGEPASVVLEFTVATNLHFEQAIPLLARARGARPEHMQKLLSIYYADTRLEAVKIDKLRASIRKVAGMRTPLLSFFPESADVIRSAVVNNEALREWAYQDKDPTTRLWLAAGGEQDLRKSCQLVQREVGFGWVQQLPASVPQVELRRFALNCGDAKASQFIHDHLLGDKKSFVDPSENSVQPLAGDVYGRTAESRVRSEVDRQDADPKQILERLGDLSASQRAAALANAGEMKQMFSVLTGADAVRAVYLLGPTIPQLLSLPIYNEQGVLDYLRSRPVEEEQQALLRGGSLVGPARSMFPRTCPFIVYPSLYDPHTLARALDAAGGDALLSWILEETEPNLALARLSMEPARTAAAPLFEARPHIYDKLPAYKHLLPKGKQGFGSIAKAVEDDDTKREAELYTTGEPQIDAGADSRAQKMSAASNENHLWDSLEVITKSHGGEASVLSLIHEAPAAEQIALLAGTHTATVEAVKSYVGRSPTHVFPALGIAQLLALPDAAAWLFETEPAYALLSRVQGPGLAQLGSMLSTDRKLAAHWINALPDAAGLTVHERQALDGLCSHITNDEVLRALFKVRYGAAVDATYPIGDVKRLWNVLARLPPAQVNQHMIRDFTHGNLGASAGGLWYEHEVVLDSKADFGEKVMETSYENSALMSAAEIKKNYGLDDEGLKKASGNGGWIEVVNGQYRVKEITNTQSFTATVLHEVGHSVDQLLGEHTDLIYGQGGWKTYGVDQFEDWANEMGALKGVSGHDRTETINAWKESLRAGRPVAEMVDADHPARNKLASDDPLLKHATDRFDYKETRDEAYGGRVFLTHGMTLASVPKKTADVAPSAYAMSAPAEYFAECYVEYYREYQGTPETMSKKGGHLATWIKQWFDTHVDQVRLSPERLNGNTDQNAAARPAKKA